MTELGNIIEVEQGEVSDDVPPKANRPSQQARRSKRRKKREADKHLRRLARIEKELAAASKAGLVCRLPASPGDLRTSVTTISQCSFCASPFIAFARPTEIVRYCRRECSPGARYIKAKEAFEAGRAAGLADAPHAEPPTACPRPDKKTWGTMEAAEQVVAFMRAAGRPRAESLHGYLCICGWHHVGDRTFYQDTTTKSA